MADLDDVRRIAMSLPGTTRDRHAFGVVVKGKSKGFAWPWMERREPKKPRVVNLDVYAVRVANLAEKEMLLAEDGAKFFTEDHYNGYPAVLVRLAEIDVDELTELLTDAWRCMAPKTFVDRFDAESGGMRE